MLKGLFDPGDALASKPRLDPNAALLRRHYKPDQDLLRLRLRVGLLVLLAAAIAAYLGRGDGFVLLLAGGFGAVALMNLFYGFLQSGFEQSLLITGSEVQVRRRMPLFGQREWREPISRFRGVTLREEQLPEDTIGKIRSTQTWYIVELTHENPDRTVPLFVDGGPHPPRDIQQAFASRFRLPALLPEGARPIARDTPLASPAKVDPGPPPAGVVVTEADGVTRIVVGQSQLQRARGLLFWLILPFAFGAVVWLLDPVMGVLAAIFVGGLVVILLLADLLSRTASERHPPTIVVDDVSVRLDQPGFRSPEFFEWTVRLLRRQVRHIPNGEAEFISSLPRSAVTMVRVDAYRKFSNNESTPTRVSQLARLVIEGPERRLILALGLTERHKLEWVRDYLQARLATG